LTKQDPTTTRPPAGRGAKPVTSWRHGRFREGALTAGAALLSRTARPLWYLESLVLSARYQQYLGSTPWGSGSKRYRDRSLLWEGEALPRLARLNATVFEFGVADGVATHWWADRGVPFKAWHGFDTFEGLPQAWHRAGVPVMGAGVFSPNAGKGRYPEVSAPYPVTWHAGLIEDTFPETERPDTPVFVLIDVDLLEPTLVVLNWLANNGRAGDLVYFDEAFDPWNEGKAVREAITSDVQARAVGHTGSALLLELT
jgi:hypothetical protein